MANELTKNRMPLPLYVSYHSPDKRVHINFRTPEEAQIFYDYISRLCGEHADRTHEEQDGKKPEVRGIPEWTTKER